MISNTEELDITFTDADFKILKTVLNDYDYKIIESVYYAITHVEAWNFIKTIDHSCNWYSNPIIAKIYNATEELEYMSHSGASFMFGMNHMTFFAKNGKKAYIEKCRNNFSHNMSL